MDTINQPQPPTLNPVLLGVDTTTKQLVSLTAQARQFSLYTIGTPGVGKSVLLESIARQDMKNGAGLCFLDPHGDSTQNLLLAVPPERAADTIFWNPKELRQSITLNPFFCPNLDDQIAVDRTVEDFISALSGLREYVEAFQNAPQMLDTLRHLAFACVLKQGTSLLDSVEFLTNSTYRHTFYSALYHHNRRDILKYWEAFDEKSPTRKEQLTSSSLNKLYRLITTSITRAIFQDYTPSIDFRTVMDKGKILLVDLSHLGVGNGELIGAFIVFGILRAAFSRGDMPEEERRPFHLFADEFERFMTTAFPQIIDEGRKFKLYCVLAHQHRGQLEGASLGSTLSIKNKIIFQVNSKDAQELSWEFDTTPPDAEPKMEIMTEPVYQTYSEDEWDTKANEERYNELTALHQASIIRLDLFYAIFGLLNIDWPDIDLMGDEVRQKSIRKALDPSRHSEQHRSDRELQSFNEKLLNLQTKFAKLTSPVFSAPIVQSYIKEHAGDIINGRLLLPAYLPSRAEQVAGQLLSVEEQMKRCQGYWPVSKYTIDPQEAIKKYGEQFKSDTYRSISSTFGTAFGYTLSAPTVTEMEAVALALFIELQSFLKPLKEQAGPYLCADSVVPKLFPSVGPWLYTQLKQAADNRQELRPKRMELYNRHHRSIRKQRERGYEIPVKTPKGQWLNERPTKGPDEEIQMYRKVAGTQKKHSDVAAEIANTLTNLPKFTARCKLDDNGQPVEYAIKTIPVPQPEESAKAQAVAIQERSRELYGRKGEEQTRHDIPPTADDGHGILDERKPADDDPNRPISRPDDPAQPKADDEDDYFR